MGQTYMLQYSERGIVPVKGRSAYLKHQGLLHRHAVVGVVFFVPADNLQVIVHGLYIIVYAPVGTDRDAFMDKVMRHGDGPNEKGYLPSISAMGNILGTLAQRIVDVAVRTEGSPGPSPPTLSPGITPSPGNEPSSTA